MAGKLYLCATPIGNLSDITFRCLEVLKSVDLIAAEDTRRTQVLLNHFEISKPMTSYFEHNRRQKGLALIAQMKEGKSVALVSDAGTPAISDPGEDLVAMCAEEGIEVVPIPGCVAAINALIVSGLPAGRFSFEGFLTVQPPRRKERLEEIKTDTRTLIFYEAPHKLKTTLKDLYKFFGNRRIALCRELTKVHEQVLRMTIEEAISYYEEVQPKGEFVLVVEGAQKAAEDFSDISVCEHVDMYIKEGLDEKEAIKKTAQMRGVPKRDVYAEYKIEKKA